MTTDAEALRAQFEHQCRVLDLSLNDDGDYTDELVYLIWLAYRQGHAAAKAETADVVAKERERCAAVCDRYASALDYSDNAYVRSRECQQAAAAIRAGAKERGE